MVTLPEEPTGRGVPLNLHHARLMAESFGQDARGYDAARPQYPDELMHRLIDGRTGLDVLDVGCGTGIAGRQFQKLGCSVLGVEPDERMAQYARTQGLDVELGTFESWDPHGRTFDIVAAAQSWHWIEPDHGAQKAAAAIRPGGDLAIFGHVFEPPGDIADAFADALRRVVPDSPFNSAGRRPLRMYESGYELIAGTLRESGAFEEVEQWRFNWTRPYQRDEWLALLVTTGGLTSVPTDWKAEILHSVGHAIDRKGGSFTMEYVTLATVGRRRATSADRTGG